MIYCRDCDGQLGADFHGAQGNPSAKFLGI
jgi:hypothetical protein